MEHIKSQYSHGRPGNIRQAEYFYYDIGPEHQAEFAIVCGGHELCAGDFFLERQSYPYYVIEYGIRGRGFIEIDGVEHEITSGVIAGFTPGMRHKYSVDSSDPLEHIFLVITGSGVEDIFEKCHIVKRGSMMSYDPQRSLQAFSNIIDTGLEKSPFSQELCCAYLKSLLFEQAANDVKKGRLHSESEKTYHRCRSYIDQRFSEITSISDVADNCCVNIRYMARLFKNYGSITPQEYVMRLKMNRAGQLLLNSDLPVKNIAMLVGFEDPYHFSRNFTKFHGISPKKYRSKHLQA
ncbi:MAG: AraC family transcriptional regulator [Sedimentisphaeraceae bacterium JB056]